MLRLSCLLARRVLAVLALGLAIGSGEPAAVQRHKYCVVGAGPAGVQLGHM